MNGEHTTPATRGAYIETLRWCQQCDAYQIRGHATVTDHTTYAVAPWDREAYQTLPEASPIHYDSSELPWDTSRDEGNADDTDDTDDPIVAHEYEVTKEVTVTVTGTVEAETRHDAKTMVSRHHDDVGVVTDSYTVRTYVQRGRDISASEYTDDE